MRFELRCGLMCVAEQGEGPTHSLVQDNGAWCTRYDRQGCICCIPDAPTFRSAAQPGELR
ncbi:hypothetical protein F751_3012 [Auxenochlorella protothecoides]|uniref:Uncharacterized protein n=1 Tax=Auxenochlorella protothecoides TaxID=3075 RepID=A0A087SI49_AUXPR|nr:hypothetical protein F751_3012 [Auxenochlorella protothecoides]KFM25403.1 hypothetical protein F751_3012 [Auxenochlorella protothecoides]